jgi:hypothetical protein
MNRERDKVGPESLSVICVLGLFGMRLVNDTLLGGVALS